MDICLFLLRSLSQLEEEVMVVNATSQGAGGHQAIERAVRDSESEQEPASPSSAHAAGRVDKHLFCCAEQ